jgi:GNAT superfamily N-acetyltransferase
VLAIQVIPADQPPATDLVAAMVEDVSALYGRIDVPGAPTATPQELSPPGGAFVAVFEDGRPIAGGGVKRLDAQACEIKRMYVVPEARGRGVAKAVLRGLEDAARARGWTTLRLETGPRQPEALGLYTGSGYRPIGPFGAYLHDPAAHDSLFFERLLEQ